MNDINNGAQITILRYPDNVRQRVGMYLSSKEHAVFEIIDNSIDEFLAGYAKNICLTIDKDIITIRDDGRGIPIEPHKDPEYAGLSQVEVAATVLHAGGKFDNAEDAYKTVTAGLNGVGLSCVNATSETMIINIYKDSNIYQAQFSKGIITQHLTKVATDSEKCNGTEISFKLDKEVWGENTAELNIAKIKNRLEQLAFLNPGLTTIFCNNDDEPISYLYPNGLKDYVTKIVGVKTNTINDIIYKTNIISDIDISVALTYTDTYTSDIITFCNNIDTTDGGDHLIGFRSGLLKAINEYAIANKFIKEENKFDVNDTLEGISAIIAIKVKDPKFISQAKNKIDMRNVRPIVSSFTESLIASYFDKYPDNAQTIIEKCIVAYNARESARKARENIRKSKNALDGSLVGKIADCQSKNPEECEVYIVEGG